MIEYAGPVLTPVDWILGAAISLLVVLIVLAIEDMFHGGNDNED